MGTHFTSFKVVISKDVGLGLKILGFGAAAFLCLVLVAGFAGLYCEDGHGGGDATWRIWSLNTFQVTTS